MTLKDYERKLNKRIWSRRAEAIGEMVGNVIVIAMFVALAWAFLKMTPSQSSAINDLAEVAEVK